MFLRVFGAVLIVLALAILFYSFSPFALHFSNDYEWKTANPSKRISILVQRDFASLSKDEALPPAWNQIKKVSFHFHSNITKALMGTELPDIRTPESNKKTKSKDAIQLAAEVEIIDLPDEESPGFIFQVSLFNTQTKNKVFEIGRTYLFKDLNKKKPD